MTVTHMLKAGDGIVSMDDVYGGEKPLCNLAKCVKQTVSYETLSCFLDYVCVMWFSDTNRDFLFFFNHKAQTATFKESQLKSAWMCLLLTAQNHNCSRLP